MKRNDYNSKYIQFLIKNRQTEKHKLTQNHKFITSALWQYDETHLQNQAQLQQPESSLIW